MNIKNNLLDLIKVLSYPADNNYGYLKKAGGLTMRIQDIDPGIKKILEKNENFNKKRVKSSDDNVETTNDKVNFSDSLKEAKKLVIDILDYPENRTEKIKKLKEMIRSGNYNVDVHKLADKFVEDLIFGNFYK